MIKIFIVISSYSFNSRMPKPFFILSLIFLLSALASSKWGTYRPGTLYSLLQTDSSHQILSSLQFGLITSNHLFQSSIVTEDSEVTSTTYVLHDGSSIFAKQIAIQSSYIEIESTCHNESCQTVFSFPRLRNATFYIYSTQPFEQKNLDQLECSETHVDNYTSVRQVLRRVVGLQQLKPGTHTLLACSVNQQSEMGTLTLNPNPNIPRIKQLATAEFNKKLDNFISSYKLSPVYRQIISYAIVQTLASVSIKSTKYSRVLSLQAEYRDKIDIKLTPFVIHILKQFDPELAEELAAAMVEVLEDTLIYDQQNLNEDICFPEHTELFTLFDHPKSIKVLNSIIFRVLYKNINKRIGKEDDYSANKQIHPLIRTMLEVKWSSPYRYLEAESMYLDSFFDDAYIHSHQEKLEVSIGKLVWLIKTIRLMIGLNQITGSELSEVELNSLHQVLIGYTRDFCMEKQTRTLRSILKAGRSSYFVSEFGYENLMPYVYGIYPKYEDMYEGTLKGALNLTTKYGLASAEPRSKNYDSSYQFRGNVWPYFNIKILSMLERMEPFEEQKILESVSGDMNVLSQYRSTLKRTYKVERKLMTLIRDSVKNKILEDWEAHQRLFSSWQSDNGRPVEGHPQLILINTLFLN